MEDSSYFAICRQMQCQRAVWCTGRGAKEVASRPGVGYTYRDYAAIQTGRIACSIVSFNIW